MLPFVKFLRKEVVMVTIMEIPLSINVQIGNSQEIYTPYQETRPSLSAYQMAIRLSIKLKLFIANLMLPANLLTLQCFRFGCLNDEISVPSVLINSKSKVVL